MTDPRDTARPKPPTPLIPDRHRQRLPLPRQDDPEAARRAEFEAKLEAQLHALQAKLAQQAPRVEVEASVPPGSRKHVLGFYIRDWSGLHKVLVAAGVLGSIALGIVNHLAKAPQPAVTKVAGDVKEIKLQVSGETDQKGAISEGESIVEQTKKNREQTGQLVDIDCKRAQWFKQVLAQAKPPIIVTVENCPSGVTPIDVEVKKQLPNRPASSVIVKTPVPTVSSKK